MLRDLNRECSLEPDERRARLSRLRALEARAIGRRGDRLLFPRDPALAAEMAELAALETGCCPVSFRLEISRSQMMLEVRKEVHDGLLRLRL